MSTKTARRTAKPRAVCKRLECDGRIVGKRFPEWSQFFTRDQLLRLAANSGGDLRDFFRMVGLCITESLYQQTLPLSDTMLSSAESALRNDMPLDRKSVV